MAVLASKENLIMLSRFGANIKSFDLNSARFKTGLVTYCDVEKKGRAAIASITNNEEAGTLSAVQTNMPCSDST